MTCSLDSYCQRSLVLRAIAGDSSGKDLASLRNISLQLIGILIINHIVFSTEYANLFSSAHTASALHRRIAFFCFIISHDRYLLLAPGHTDLPCGY